MICHTQPQHVHFFSVYTFVSLCLFILYVWVQIGHIRPLPTTTNNVDLPTVSEGDFSDPNRCGLWSIHEHDSSLPLVSEDTAYNAQNVRNYDSLFFTLQNGGGGGADACRTHERWRKNVLFFLRLFLDDAAETCTWSYGTALSRRMVYSTSFVAFSTSAATGTAYGQENPGQKAWWRAQTATPPSLNVDMLPTPTTASALLHFTEWPHTSLVETHIRSKAYE
jgi:hypothetical protein